MYGTGNEPVSLDTAVTESHKANLLGTVPAISGPRPSANGLAVGKTIPLALLHIPTAKEADTIHASVTSSTGLHQMLLDVVSCDQGWSWLTSNALRMTSTILWLVCVFPAYTAAYSEGFRIPPSGLMTSMGERQPWLSGISSLMRHRSE